MSSSASAASSSASLPPSASSSSSSSSSSVSSSATPSLSSFSNQPLVIDNGSAVMKAGFAGTEVPKLICPSHVGRPKHLRVMQGAAEGEVFVGERAKDLRGLLKLNYPIRHGTTVDWEDQHTLWSHCYSELNAAQDQHPVLLTENPLAPRHNRGKAAEVFFETFNVPAFYVSHSSILSLYASGRTTGCVLDIGDGVSSVTPIFEGFALPHSISRSDIAGRDVTEYLQLLLRKSGHNFISTAEMEVVRDIKEKLCYVAYNIDSHLQRDVLFEGINHSSSSSSLSLAHSLDTVEPEVQYKLPDGSVISLSTEKYRATELLFNPHLIGSEYPGCQQLLLNSIGKSDLDIRRSLFSHIILAGGSTMFDGFGDRLLAETRKLSPRDTKIKIWAPPERTLSTWVGGSILASLATFKKMWITRQEYEEQGKNAIYRKTF